MLSLALYQPEIAANVGACIRISACFDSQLHIIEPCGFPWKKRDIERVALDYGALSSPIRHRDWENFRESAPGRLVLLTTKASLSHTELEWQENDILLLGQESAGVPTFIHNEVDARVIIPIAANARSLNMAVSGAIALSEARRQVGWPDES